MLIEHPAVVEAGVIGTPDPVAMEVVKAYVALKDGIEPTEELRRKKSTSPWRKRNAVITSRVSMSDDP